MADPTSLFADLSEQSRAEREESSKQATKHVRKLRAIRKKKQGRAGRGIRNTSNTERFSTKPVKRLAEEAVGPMVIEQLRKKGYIDTKAVMRRLVGEAEKIGKEQDIDALEDNIYKRPHRWANQFIKRMRPQILEALRWTHKHQ
jgi:hypothetical protein